MNEDQQAEWLQKLCLVGIGLVMGSSGDLLWLPYDSWLSHILEAMETMVTDAAPVIILALLALYVGLETVTEDNYIENVIFTESTEKQ